MKKNVLSLLTIGFSCFSLFLQAQQSAPAATKETQSSPSTTIDHGEDQKEMAAWKLETGQVAKDYLSALDSGQYSQSWSKVDPLFQRTVPQNEWIEAMNLSRKKYGAVRSRTLKLHKIGEVEPRGLPKGLYAEIEYDTSFANKPNVTELLTLRKDPDGKWRVLTYQVND